MSQVLRRGKVLTDLAIHLLVSGDSPEHTLEVLGQLKDWKTEWGHYSPSLLTVEIIESERWRIIEGTGPAKPLDSQHAAKPLDSQHAAKPLDSQHAAKPLDSQHAAKPLDSQHAAKPLDSVKSPEPQHTVMLHEPQIRVPESTKGSEDGPPLILAPGQTDCAPGQTDLLPVVPEPPQPDFLPWAPDFTTDYAPDDTMPGSESDARTTSSGSLPGSTPDARATSSGSLPGSTPDARVKSSRSLPGSKPDARSKSLRILLHHATDLRDGCSFAAGLRINSHFAADHWTIGSCIAGLAAGLRGACTLAADLRGACLFVGFVASGLRIIGLFVGFVASGLRIIGLFAGFVASGLRIIGLMDFFFFVSVLVPGDSGLWFGCVYWEYCCFRTLALLPRPPSVRPGRIVLFFLFGTLPSGC
ncbi:hypothetical protein CRENBAI_003379 [Crenichthys baileyi]|uniref:Uncharacterized protein n=1 Tax=Crenichthys baileyi TaxID=28760 RepID=A0AAV9RNP1_9TELE